MGVKGLRETISPTFWSTPSAPPPVLASIIDSPLSFMAAPGLVATAEVALPLASEALPSLATALVPLAGVAPGGVGAALPDATVRFASFVKVRCFERKSLAQRISLEVARRWKSARNIALMRESSDIALATSGRAATARATSTESGLFMKNNACCGTMVEPRLEFAISGSA